jgi:MoaE-MoaD fusion protein
MQQMIHVTVRLFGPAIDLAGSDTFEYALAPLATLGTLLELLYARHPRLAARAEFLRFAVNEEYARPSQELHEGDEVAIVPPVSGGGPELALLTAEPIDRSAFLSLVRQVACGAVVTFEGVVRPDALDGRQLLALEYSAYDGMARRQLERVRDEALARFQIREAAVVHRVGRVAVGELSVVAVVAAEHRDAAFEACRWIIDELKKDLPVWKREMWSGGQPTWAGAREITQP